MATTPKEVQKGLMVYKGKIKGLLPDHVGYDRFINSAVMAVHNSEELQKCSKESIFGCVIDAAEIGLDFTKAKGQAYLVPFKGEATLIPGYKGLLQLVYNTKKVSSFEVRLVYESDDLVVQFGTESKIKHTPTLIGKRGKLLGVYGVAHFTDPALKPYFDVMTIEEVDKIMNSAPGSSRADSPWKKHKGEQVKKTMVRRLCKMLPISSDEKLSMAISSEDSVFDTPPEEIPDITPPGLDPEKEVEQPKEEAGTKKEKKKEEPKKEKEVPTTERKEPSASQLATATGPLFK
jgi:recombination protein RecT